MIKFECPKHGCHSSSVILSRIEGCAKEGSNLQPQRWKPENRPVCAPPFDYCKQKFGQIMGGPRLISRHSKLLWQMKLSSHAENNLVCDCNQRPIICGWVWIVSQLVSDSAQKQRQRSIAILAALIDKHGETIAPFLIQFKVDYTFPLGIFLEMI